jgi:thiamine-phosphate pyrophosphorylase
VRQFEQGLSAQTAGQPKETQDASLLIAHRDIVGDVGQSLSTAAEMERRHPSEVMTAAGKRLSEALRAIEEYGKVLDREFAVAVERLRYRGYELERRLALVSRAQERFGDVRLYVIITEVLCRRGWFETAKAALEGGADCLQLREKGLSDRELLDRAARLCELCRDHQKLLIVNDRSDIAAAAKSHGVHVGQDDLPLPAVRRVLPAGCILGISTHTAGQVEQAATEAPDYIAVGPMFPTTTKPQPLVATPQLLATARGLTSIPLVAIGGITRENADAVVAAGANCLCVCTAVIGAHDPGAAAHELREKVQAARTAKPVAPSGPRRTGVGGPL